MSRKFITENFNGEHPFLYAPCKEKTDKITKSKYYPPERIEIDFEPTNEVDDDWEDKELHDQIKTTVSTLTEKPMRFSDERQEHKKHPFMWVPFGGGAHKCIGLHFADMVFKCVSFQVIKQYHIKFADESQRNAPMQYFPFTKPKNDLPLILNHPE